MNHTEFATICRNLRIAKGYKQREVAAAIGIELSSYSNVESSRWRTIGIRRVERLIGFYGLNAEQAGRVMSAWEACPLSPEGEKQLGLLAKRREYRAKARGHEPLRLALVELLGAHLMALPDAEICTCEFGEPLCATCNALERLVLPAFSPADRGPILEALGKMRSAAAESGTPAPRSP